MERSIDDVRLREWSKAAEVSAEPKTRSSLLTCPLQQREGATPDLDTATSRPPKDLIPLSTYQSAINLEPHSIAHAVDLGHLQLLLMDQMESGMGREG